MSVLEEAIKKQRELYEDRGGAIHHEILATLVRAKEEVDRLAYQLRDYAETWHKIQRHNGTFDNCGSPSCAPARAALALFQPGRGAVKP